MGTRQINPGLSQERVGWNVREALYVLLGISLLQTALYYIGFVSLDSLDKFVGWSLLDALMYSGGIYLFVKLKKHGGWADLGLNSKRLMRSILIGMGAGIVIAVTVTLAGDLMVKLLGRSPEPQPVQVVAEQAAGWWRVGVFLFAGSLVAPVKEELVFRGFLYPALRDRVGVTWGILLTTLFFALVHGDLLRFAPLLMGGAALNLLFVRTRSLYAAIAAHGVWNGIMALLVFWR